MGFHYRWFDRDQEKIDEMGIPLSRAEIDAREHAKQPERLFSRGEQTGIVLSSVIFAYGWIEGDLSLSFFCLSFLIFELRKIVQQFSHTYGKSIANGMQGFSIALILGALAMVLTT
ncbi:hypothetical protein [Selenomonas sp. oral taxon 892]|jgi:hypothetical protein|uniref:hypothetical protein n=1 Tax=Selenomonas sp. oral taxon 892 TaxID=1321785 RepID=UPI0003AD296A|nr:hypothetical protein [Selenomonas sp. oral taxon 892]ERJ89303.1 hypothetical protein HMPREF1992_02314 [Selenomonas sp. oral taxon 892 str. F0426]